MSRGKILFNGTMALTVRAGLLALVFTFANLPFRTALLNPDAVFGAGVPESYEAEAVLALLFVAFFGGLALSGLYVFVRTLMGVNLISDPVRWREQAAARRAIRLAIFAWLLAFWLPQFLSPVKWAEWASTFVRGEDLSNPDGTAAVFVAITLVLALRLGMGLAAPVPRHVRRAEYKGGYWIDFLEDFLPGSSAYDDRAPRHADLDDVAADAGVAKVVHRPMFIFNAVMGLILRGGLLGLFALMPDTPFPQAFLEPEKAFADLGQEAAESATLALLFVSFFGGLTVSGIYVLIRALMGANLISDPARWREQAVVRRTIRLVAFLVLPLFWMPAYLASGADSPNDGALIATWAVWTAYFFLSFLRGILGPPPFRKFRRLYIPSILHPLRRPSWIDFMDDFWLTSDAFGDGRDGGRDYGRYPGKHFRG